MGAARGSAKASSSSSFSSASPPPAPTLPSELTLWARAKEKLIEMKDFAWSYFEGVSLLAREVRAAARLAARIYVLGHRSSRRERLQLSAAARDVAKSLPIAGFMMVAGIELSTLVVLRFVPSLLPRAVHSKVAPKFNASVLGEERLALC